MQKNNAETVLFNVINLLTLYLSELSNVQNEPSQQFEYGEKTAYTECLEMLLTWGKAEKKGLKFNVEQYFPL